MRELLLFHIYSGQLFFTAAGLFLLVVVLDLFGILAKRPLLLRVARVTALLSIPLAALSGTPLPGAVLFITLLTTLTYILLRLGRSHEPPRGMALLAVANVIVCLAYEGSWRRGGAYIQPPSRLIVVGDSLSSGGFGETTGWPQLLAQRFNEPLVNLANASDTASGALANQIPRLPARANTDLVIVEIGGNDMLEGVPARQFETALDQILVSLAGRQVVMLELPVIPGRWRYGAAQRRLSAKHRVLLAPKSILARVLLESRNTTDGLHLTQRGHDALALAIGGWLAVRDERSTPATARPGARR